MVIFLYNLYIFIWIQHGCLVKMAFALDPSNCGVIIFSLSEKKKKTLLVIYALCVCF